jgi:hypothetical protein
VSLRRALAALVAIAGCHAGSGPGPAGPSGAFTVTERAEAGPIAAIAFKPPFLWASGSAGLRRFDVTSGEYESVGEPNDARTRAVTAIAIDDDGGAWTAGAMGIGRWVAAGDDLRYEPKGTPGPVNVLVARRPVATEGIWAGGPGGLYRYDGRIFPSIDGIREVPVSSIVLDDDGKSAWVGTFKHGVYHAEGDHAAPVPGGEAILLDAVLGIAKTSAGTRVAAGNANGEARLYALTMAGVEGFHAAPGPVVVALVDRGGDARGGGAVLIAGPPGKPQAYTLRALGPTEPLPPGSLKFSSLVRERAARWAAIPAADKLPPETTMGAGAGGDVFVGSVRMGVARAAPENPRYVVGSQLVGDAHRLYVACASPVRCFVVADGPRAWLTDGDRYQPTRLGEPEAATPLALATDAQGTVYAIAREAETDGLVITRLAPGVRAPVETDWQPLHKIALQLPPKTTPTVSFAAVSGANTLWLGLRVAGADGADSGYGAVEIELGNGHAVQHRPHKAGEKVAPEALPLASSLTGILFDSGATYYASLAGVSRWQEGQLRTWSENDGLASELVHAIARGSDGAIWVATSGGLATFDGQNWRPLGTTGLVTRGLATDGKGRVWVATGKGLRALPPGATAADADPGRVPIVLAGEMRDVAADRFGRIWAMSATSIALVQE